MLKTIIKLPDGTKISSGSNAVNAIQSATLTECVNSGEDLTIGSTCSNALEVTLITPAGGLSLEAGTEVTAYKDDGTGQKEMGVFILEKPTKPTANTMKVTGYDRVSKLDKDLTAWLSGRTEWPYLLTTFACMVCEACGLTFKETEVPNGDFLVNKFTRSSVTGRQLMQWLGEICCRFCRATPKGEIEFAWYTDSGKTITPSGDTYYLQNSLTYEDYTTAEIEMVQIRTADSENGALWPKVDGTPNSYIITGNPILNLRITEELLPVLANIKGALAGVRYTPCKVSIPARLDIRAGNTVAVTDKNGKTFTAYVMTKTQAGQKDTLECTGSHRRDSSAAVNNQSAASSGEAAAQNAFAGMTHEQMFNKWTDGGRIQGLFSQDDVWVFNAAVGKVVNLLANVITAGILKSKDGKAFYLDLDNGILKMQASELSISGKTVDAIAQGKADAALLDAKDYADGAAKSAVDAQTAEQIFDKWTDGGKIKGIMAEDGVWVFNADVGKIENLIANIITAGVLRSKDGTTYFDLDNDEIATSHSTDFRDALRILAGTLTLYDSSRYLRLMLTTIDDNSGMHFFKTSGNLSCFLGTIDAPDPHADNFVISLPEYDSGALVTARPYWRDVVINGETVKIICGLEVSG